MSNEVLEFSVLIDEKFDVRFNLSTGILGFILKMLSKFK